MAALALRDHPGTVFSNLGLDLRRRAAIGIELQSRRERLKPSFAIRATAYRVLLKMPLGEKMISCPDDKSILDAAEDANLELPFFCRAGSCPACAGKLEMGSVDQGGNAFMGYEHIDQGFVLTCIAYPTSDLVVITHAEDELVASLL
ncbi:hypothetical protein SELMODRAFT_88349 [Selaginella moellendorffii]|uniref:Ferredoxin n=1 Tax=Selaginella moellendorffii TaxID=88036 RepID=D8RA79_SELML|nr:ferredoxin [Selaginella moellendorffii]EFJ31283.1 hypothetical protein SELMODRAFT_88349 [Selaginella moellendorffii]|eukprot:XP_002967936.1 ferredoxin [Selaginella moellendorffii]